MSSNILSVGMERLFIHSFNHLFNKHLLRAYYVSGPMLDAEDIERARIQLIV